MSGKRQLEEDDYEEQSPKRGRPAEDDEDLDEEAILRLVDQAPNVSYFCWNIHKTYT